MTLKSLVLKIVIVVGILILLYVVFLYGTLRTKSKDLTNISPYSDIIGTDQTTEQVCYIAKNYEHYVKENAFILKQTSDFDSEAGKAYELPIGSPIVIENAKAFTNGVSGSTSNMILGRVFIKELNKEVAFEYNWDSEKPYHLKNYEQYLRYPLTPWQKNPIPLKYSVEDGSSSSYEWPARTNKPVFNSILEKIWCNDAYMGNRNFENTTFEKDRYETGMKGYYDTYSQITKQKFSLLQLQSIYPDILNNSSKYIVGNDHRLNLSPNFVSIIITVQIEINLIEQTLIHYDLEGNYIDHLLLSSAIRSNGPIRVSSIEGSKITIEENSQKESYYIQNNGHFISENQNTN